MINAEQFRQLSINAEYGYGWLLLTVALMLALSRLFIWKHVKGLPDGRFSALIVRLWSQVQLVHIGVLALVVRIPKLFETLWYDELFTARMVGLPLSQLPGAILGDVHPPLPYLIQWITARLYGTSEAALRLPSLIAGLFAVYLVYRLAVVLRASHNAGLIAALFTALSPAMIYYSAEARVYQLLACVVFSAVLCILERRGRWLWLALGLLPHLHNIGFVYLAVLGAAALIYDRRLFPSVFAAGVIGAMWLPGVLIQMRDVTDGFWVQPLTLPGAAWTIIRGTVGTTFPALLLVGYVPAIAVTFMAAWHFRRWFINRDGIVFTALVIGVPLALALASWFWTPVFLIRALLPCGAALVILWSKFLDTGTPAARLAAGALIPAMIVSCLSSFIVPRAMDYRSILSNCEGVDTVVYTDVPGAFIGTYYLSENYLLWTGANDLNQSLTPAAKAAFGFVQSDGSQLAGRVCIVVQDSALASPDVNTFVSSLIDAHDYTELMFYPNESRAYFRIRIILVDL